MKLAIAVVAAMFAAPLAAQPQDITAPGTVDHRAARADFPERVGEFQRTGVTRFDAEGRDISANYEAVRGDSRMRLSVYIYPAPPAPRGARGEACRELFEGVGQSIALQHGGADRIEQGPAPAVSGVEPAFGLRSVHRIRSSFLTGRDEELRSESVLYCYVGSDWLVKYRATSNFAFEGGNAIEAFVRSGPWPGRRSGEIALAY